METNALVIYRRNQQPQVVNTTLNVAAAVAEIEQREQQNVNADILRLFQHQGVRRQIRARRANRVGTVIYFDVSLHTFEYI